MNDRGEREGEREIPGEGREAVCPLTEAAPGSDRPCGGELRPGDAGASRPCPQKRRARFSRVYVTLFVNAEKHCLFPEEQRLRFLSLACGNYPNVTVDAWEGLLADYAREKGIRYVVKGYRDENDLAYERLQARVNHGYFPGLFTVLLPAGEEYRQISSTAVRLHLARGESLAGLVPPSLVTLLPETYEKIVKSKK